jgi:hypothetical protein
MLVVSERSVVTVWGVSTGRCAVVESLVRRGESEGLKICP